MNREEYAENQVPEHVPTILDLKKSLPSECFTPLLTFSFYYVLKESRFKVDRS
jgi:hypothetical protein